MARYAPGHKQQTRERILQSAGRLLRTRGYAQSGVAQLMGASDLTVGGFYAHFASKEALFGEVLQRSLTDLSSLLLAGLEDVKGVPFVREVARRYAGTNLIGAYQIWNEQDTPAHLAQSAVALTPQVYGTILTAAIRAIRDATARRVTAAGGITTREEIDALHAMGVDAVVGMAIYTGWLALDW